VKESLFPVVDKSDFFEIVKVAYGWVLDDEGYLCGLTHGDMGYTHTDMKLTTLFEEALFKEEVRLFKEANFPCEWPLHTMCIDFIKLAAEEMQK
jgi:hypothetical protein